MTQKLTSFYPTEHLKSNQAISDFDPGFIAHALGIVARARGMSQIASQTGLSREQLYRSFSTNGNPTLRTALAVIKALGIELSVKPATSSVAAR